ncbi:flavin reductase family protein [Ethanoligenens sp.]|uniref:flavin reductase family protein n=1 Tax=Ethanoligenens sp. TaxID=2099655 RepID=UPI0039E8CD42
MMKKDIGPVIALYPTPTTIIGTVIKGKVNWLIVAHVGILGHDAILLSSHKTHYTNQGIKENRTVSVNLVSEDILAKADYVGSVSGESVDKSHVFDYHMGQLKNVPIIDESPLTMECEVVDIYDSEHHDNFIVKVVHTHVEDKMLDGTGKIDYEKLKPILFEMPTGAYLKTGAIAAKCWDISKSYKSKGE